MNIFQITSGVMLHSLREMYVMILCVYEGVYIYVCVYIYIYVCLCVCVCAYVCVCVCVCVSPLRKSVILGTRQGACLLMPDLI